MDVNQKQLTDTQVELDIKLNAADILPYLERTARNLSLARPIPGFRPGKASFDVARKYFGVDLIFKESLDDIINGSLNQTLAEKKIRVFAEGDFRIQDQSPDSIRYTVSFTVLPAVTLGDWQSRQIAKPDIVVTDAEVADALKDLTRMLAKEQAVARPAQTNDKTILDFEVSVEGKVIDGGVGNNYPIVIGEKKMIPGFEEQVIGHRAGEEFAFKLNFPKNYAVNLGGKEANFKVKLHSVQERILPVLTDELAKNLGEKNVASLTARVTGNIKNEKTARDQERLEIEAIKAVVDSATIGAIPDKAVDMESDRFLKEFEHDLTHQGLTMEGYLKTAGKTVEDIKKEFRPKVLERVKASLVISQIIDENNLEVSDKELEAEVNDQRKYFARKNPQAVKELDTPDYRKYLYNQLINRKAIKFIAEKLVK